VPTAEQLSMQAMAWIFGDPARLERGQRAAWLGSAPLARGRGKIGALPPPLSGWTSARDAPAVPSESFRAWWRRTRGERTTDRRWP
jgi:L-lactate dehydrogenase complex protein LldF